MTININLAYSLLETCTVMMLKSRDIVGNSVILSLKYSSI